MKWFVYNLRVWYTGIYASLYDMEIIHNHFIWNLTDNQNNYNWFHDLHSSDGDRKAYYESSQWTVTRNDQKIAQLRKENKELHKLVCDRLAVSWF